MNVLLKNGALRLYQEHVLSLETYRADPRIAVLLEKCTVTYRIIIYDIILSKL